MSRWLIRGTWLTILAGTLLATVPMAWADDDDGNTGGSAPDYSAYYQAYQQWLQFQQKIYEDRRRDWEAFQAQMKKDRLDRQLYNPPITEIFVAEPLNALLLKLTELQTQGTLLPDVPITDTVLQHTNLTTGINPGNLAILKNNGFISWPMALRRDDWKSRETRLELLTTSLVKQVRGDDIQPNDYRQALALLDQAQAQWKDEVARMPASEYIQGKRFLTDLTAAVKALSEPDASQFFLNKQKAKGQNVAELVAYMRANGLKFAPATAADKPAYLALHQALASCVLNAEAQNFVQ